LLEEDEQSASSPSRDVDPNAATNSTDVTVSHSPSVSASQEVSDDVQPDSSTTTCNSVPDHNPSTDIQSGSSDLPSEDPWLPAASTKFLSPSHVSAARNNSVWGGGKCQPQSRDSLALHCCNAVTGPQSPCDHPDRCVVSSSLQCHCASATTQKRLHRVPETRTTVDFDEVVLNWDAGGGFRHNLTEIQEEMPVANCSDAAHSRIDSANCSANPVQQQSSNSGGDGLLASAQAEDLSVGGLRPTRRASLNGLRNAVRSVLIHRTSPVSDCPAADATELCRSPPPFQSSPSKLSEQSATTTEKAGGRWSYFGRRSGGGGGVAVDSVRQSLTHLLRSTGGDHAGSSVVGQRMAATSCLERPVSSAVLTLTGTRRTCGRRAATLSGDFDDFEVLPPVDTSKPAPSETDNNEFESEEHTTTQDFLSPCDELDTSDSFYESRLFDALEADDAGGFDTDDSSDGGTYSATGEDSWSDAAAPSDEQPTTTTTTSSASSLNVDRTTVLSAGQMQSCNPTAIANNGEQAEKFAPAVQFSRGFDVVKSARKPTDAAGCRCSLTALPQQQATSGLTDITDSMSTCQQLRWKRLSL